MSKVWFITGTPRASAASGPRPRSSAATRSPPPRATPTRCADLVERYGDAVLADRARRDRQGRRRRRGRAGARALRPPRRRRQQRRLRPVRHDRGGHRGAGPRADRDEPVRRAVGHAGGAADPARAGLGPHHPGVVDRRRQRVPDASASTTPPSGAWRASASRWPPRSRSSASRSRSSSRPATAPTGRGPSVGAGRAHAGLRRRARASVASARRAAGRPGDPEATGPAILELVDADEPPLRVFFGSGPLDMIKRASTPSGIAELGAVGRPRRPRRTARQAMSAERHPGSASSPRRPRSSTGIDLTRQARDRHRRRVRASASRPPARWPAPAPRSRSPSATWRPASASRPRSTRDARVARLDLADLASRRRVRRALGRPAAPARQQRGRDGHPGADAQPRRAARCSSRRTTSGTSRSPLGLHDALAAAEGAPDRRRSARAATCARR